MESKETHDEEVCPARAGMILVGAEMQFGVRGLPRTRGDDPFTQADLAIYLGFAPHARG